MRTKFKHFLKTHRLSKVKDKLLRLEFCFVKKSLRPKKIPETINLATSFFLKTLETGCQRITFSLHFDKKQWNFTKIPLAAATRKFKSGQSYQVLHYIYCSTVAYNCHSMNRFPWVTCWKTAVWPMTKLFSNLTYEKTADWPMTKQFYNLTYDKTADWPMTKQFSNLTYDKTAVWLMTKQFSNWTYMTKKQFDLW